MHITPADVNYWLENTKLTVADPLDAGVEAFATSKVIGRLAGAFETTTWVDPSTTPQLVKQLIAMLYAAATYRKSYSEDLEGDGVGLNWAEWLEQSVEGYLNMVFTGEITLTDPEIDITGTNVGLPSFYPTDLSSVTEPPKFTMGAKF